jgi:hypothetical protein
MLYKNNQGIFIEINKYEFINDKLYYQTIKNLILSLNNDILLNQKKDLTTNINNNPINKVNI